MGGSNDALAAAGVAGGVAGGDNSGNNEMTSVADPFFSQTQGDHHRQESGDSGLGEYMSLCY